MLIAARRSATAASSSSRAARIGTVVALASLAGLPGVSPAAAAAQSVRSATAVTSGQPATSAPAPPTNTECVNGFLKPSYPKAGFTACYSPRQLQRAYGLLPLYARGYDGKGRTIVVADPFGSPTIRHDLGVFDQAFGLPAPPSFRIIQPAGRVPPYDRKNSLMVAKARETTLDVEVAHAIAPGASILLLETPGPTLENVVTGGGYPQLMAAENYAIEHNLGDVISQSFSLPEQNFPSGAIQRLRYAYVNALSHHVSVLAAANDSGVTGVTATGKSYYQHRIVQWPASDPLVTGVGGTKLFLGAAGNRIFPDTAWNDTYAVASPFPWAGGGGLSRIFGRPPDQDSVRGVVGGHRGVPDISLSAAGSAGPLIYASFPGNGFPFSGWMPANGTSEATPEFAGIVAIADQYAGHRLGLISPALYLLSRIHAPGIVDVTRGNNTVSFQSGAQLLTVPGYQAKPGYDLVTGVGTPDAGRLVPELAAVR